LIAFSTSSAPDVGIESQYGEEEGEVYRCMDVRKGICSTAVWVDPENLKVLKARHLLVSGIEQAMG
jgi:hypothetical protein